MKSIRLLVLAGVVISLAHHNNTYAQDSLLQQIAAENSKLFQYQNGEFSGVGWDFIKEKINSSKNVLIGEDHFSNEIPAFIQSIVKTTDFDNFYIEIDPYSTKIIENTFKKMSEEARAAFNKEYSELFSFYALKPEYELLEYIMGKGTNLLGADQVVMYADRLIFQEIIKTTSSEEAKTIYAEIIDKSASHLKQFLENPAKPMYFMTPEFSADLLELQQLELSAREDQIIEDMQRSVIIYQEQNHRKRVQLILNQLMKDYPKWKDAKNLFKYGANHMARGESFLTIHDIGNVVANISSSNYESSFHLMIIGESGMLGAPFKTFPPSPVDIENGFYLSYLKPLFKITAGKSWHMFDLLPLRRAVENNSLTITNTNLLRVIKGFDVLVIIPEVSPAKF